MVSHEISQNGALFGWFQRDTKNPNHRSVDLSYLLIMFYVAL